LTGNITLRDVQELMRKHYFERDSRRGVHATFTWFVEEVGELAEAILNNGEGAEEEIADVLAWLASLANLLSIDLEKAFKMKYLNPSPP
jgi:NTP pyrophosphatase (non-canonical NTP hydrolase)